MNEELAERVQQAIDDDHAIRDYFASLPPDDHFCQNGACPLDMYVCILVGVLLDRQEDAVAAGATTFSTWNEHAYLSVYDDEGKSASYRIIPLSAHARRFIAAIDDLDEKRSANPIYDGSGWYTITAADALRLWDETAENEITAAEALRIWDETEPVDA